MKIIMKPYKNSITPWTIPEKLLFWKKSDDELVNRIGYIIAYGFKPTMIPTPEDDWLTTQVGIKQVEKRTLLAEVIYKLNDFIPERKVKIRIDSFDVWNLDTTLRPIIYECLLKLKEEKHGSPYTDDEDVPKGLRATYKDDVGNDNTVHERWDWILNEMIFSFDQRYYDSLEDQMTYNSPEYNNLKIRLDNGRRLFAKYYNGLWN